MRNDYCGYVRVSTARQGEQGVSLQQQKDAISVYAKRAGLTISEWFEEQETAAKRGRPIFNQMLQRLRSGRVRGVVIHKIDRSARNLRDWADIGELIDRGVEVHFANEALDLNSRGGRLSADIQAVVASDYIRNLREETKKGFYGRLKQGFFPMPAPLGYFDQGGGKPKVLDSQTAPLVRKVFELYASGAYNFERLLVEVERMGLKGRGGTSMSLNGLSKLLNNEFYAGMIHVKKTGEDFIGVHEPLIRRDLFERVQDILHGKVNTRSIAHDFLFRRRLTCALCSATLIGEVQKRHVYYRCQNRDCETTSIREENADMFFVERFKQLGLSRYEQRYALQQLGDLRADSARQQQIAVQSLEMNLQAIIERLDRLTDAYVDRLIDRDLFEARRKTLLSERLDTEQNLSLWQTGKRSMADEIQEILERANNACLLYKSAEVPEKREVVDSVTSNRLLREKTLAITLRKPFETVAQRHFLVDGRPSRGIHRTWKRLLKNLAQAIQSSSESLSRATTFPAREAEV